MNILMAGFVDSGNTKTYNKFKVAHTSKSGIYEITFDESLKEMAIVVATSAGDGGRVAAVTHSDKEKAIIKLQRWENGNFTFADCSFYFAIIEAEH